MAKKCCANCEHSNCTLSCGAYEIWECKALVLIENHNPIFPVSNNFCCSWWNKPYEVVRKEYEAIKAKPTFKTIKCLGKVKIVR